MGLPWTVTLSPPQADEGSGFFVRLWRTQNDRRCRRWRSGPRRRRRPGGESCTHLAATSPKQYRLRPELSQRRFTRRQRWLLRVDRNTVDFLYEHTKAAPQRQLEAIHALDGKLLNVFSVASIVISLAGFTVAKGSSAEPAVVKVTLAVAVVLYLFGATAAIAGLWIKRARETRSGGQSVEAVLEFKPQRDQACAGGRYR